MKTNESDPINRNKLLAELDYYISHTDAKSKERYDYEKVRELIVAQPAARCENCRYNQANDDDIERCINCTLLIESMKNDSFTTQKRERMKRSGSNE